MANSHEKNNSSEEASRAGQESDPSCNSERMGENSEEGKGGGCRMPPKATSIMQMEFSVASVNTVHVGGVGTGERP